MIEVGDRLQREFGVVVVIVRIKRIDNSSRKSSKLLAREITAFDTIEATRNWLT